MNNRKRLLKSSILALIFLVLLVTYSITYAWYTNTTQIGKIDAETKSITLAYKLNGSDENVSTYSVANLAFFDHDNPNELKYLNQMHTVIEIDLVNYSSDYVNYYVEFNSEKVVTTVDGVTTSIAYIAGYISDSSELEIDINGSNSVSNYMSYSSKFESEVNLYPDDGSNASARAKLYLHIVGLQEIDTATNDFLVDSNGNLIDYEFTLTIHSEGVTDEPEVEEVE